MSDWISVGSKRKPQMYQPILIGRSESGGIEAVMFGHYDEEEDKFISSFLGVNREFLDATHWMPLPPPPKD